MKEEQATRLWVDMGGIAELYLDELEADAAKIAAKIKARRRVKIGALAAAAASISAALAFVIVRPKLATVLARRAVESQAS